MIVTQKVKNQKWNTRSTRPTKMYGSMLSIIDPASEFGAPLPKPRLAPHGGSTVLRASWSSIVSVSEHTYSCSSCAA